MSRSSVSKRRNEIGDGPLFVGLNRPAFPGGSKPWEGGAMSTKLTKYAPEVRERACPQDQSSAIDGVTGITSTAQ